jgi:carboxylate-amine ligase
LALGLVATLAGMVDEGRPLPVHETRWIEENLWRAIRYGLDGKLVDWDRWAEVPAPDALRKLVEWVAPAGETLGLGAYLSDVERLLSEGNGAQIQGRALAQGMSIHDVHAAAVARANAIVGDDGR